MCARGAVLGAFGRAARAHTVPTTARSPLSVLMAAHKPSGVRGVRGPCRRQRSRTQHTRQRRRREWAKSGASVGALRSRLARTAVGVHARRSLDAADAVRWSRAAGDLGFPGEKCGTPRRAHQLLSCDGLSGVNGSVASRGVSAAYTIHVRVYIFATARAAAAIAEREASQRPTRENDPDAKLASDASARRAPPA